MFFLLFGLAADTRADSPRDFLRALNAGTHRSLTGQFVIRDAPATGERSRKLSGATNLVCLDPTLLAVSCERIKKALLSELGATSDNWRGRILINLHRSDNPDETIVVEPALIRNVWEYHIEMPDLMERSRLVSAMIEVLLLEMAERGSGQSTEIPAWLAQGMSREVMLSTPMELVLEPPQKTENGVTLTRLEISGRRTDPLTLAHEDLHAVAPLTLDELSWPREGQFDGEAGEAYRSSAQLLVHDLLGLPDGRKALQALLPELTHYLNWQLSFLNAFRVDFASQLEFEKWWALQVVQFSGRELTQNWSSAESWRKLDEVLRPEMQVRVGGSEAPFHTQVSLQAVIKDWDESRQTKLLKEKVQQLQVLRMWVSQDLIQLVDAYRRTLVTYLRRREGGISFRMGKNPFAQQLDLVLLDTLHQLDELEAQRQELRPPSEPDAPITASAPVNN